MRLLTAEEAFKLAEQGRWVKYKGYNWRNKGDLGQCLACGDYPDNIRSSSKFTIESFKYHGNVWVEIKPAQQKGACDDQDLIECEGLEKNNGGE